MGNWQKQIRIPTVALFILVLLLFGLMWVPGVMRVTPYEGAYDTIYFDLLANDMYSLLSGVITGLTLPVLIICLTSPSRGSMTTAAVMLELAAGLAFMKLPLGIVFRTASNTPLSYAIGMGTIVAMVFAFSIQRKVPFQGKANPFTKKQMALYTLILTAVFALSFVKWYWKVIWPDMTISYGNYYDNIQGNIAAVLAAFSANFALLHCLGLLKSRPNVCGVFSLAAVACTVYTVITMYRELTVAQVVILLPAYIISAIQIAVGLRLLLGKRKKNDLSAA